MTKEELTYLIISIHNRPNANKDLISMKRKQALVAIGKIKMNKDKLDLILYIIEKVETQVNDYNE